MPSYVTPKKNTAFRFYIELIDQANTKLFKVNPTLATGDFQLSIDGGAFANLATIPVVTPAGSRSVQVDLSASEMNGNNIVVQMVDAAGAEWCDAVALFQTTTRQIDDLAFPTISGRGMVVDSAGLVDANMVKAGPSGTGTAQTARDLGSSVLLSSGAGTGQVNLSSGNVTLSAAGSATLTEGYPQFHSAGTINQLLYEIRAMLMEKALVGQTLTLKKVDGITAVETFTLNSSTAPTQITRAT